MSVDHTTDELRAAFAAQVETMPPAPPAPDYRPRTGLRVGPLAAAAAVVAVVAGVAVGLPAAGPTRQPAALAAPSSTVDPSPSPIDIGASCDPGQEVWVAVVKLVVAPSGVCLGLVGPGPNPVPADATPITLDGHQGWTWTVNGVQLFAVLAGPSGQQYLVVVVAHPGDEDLVRMRLQDILDGVGPKASTSPTR